MHTILQAILVIRKHGLKHRIKAPEKFISEINALCMSMASSSRKPKSKKERKRVFRELKKIAKIIRRHGQTYGELLREKRAEQTDLSPAQAAQILERLDKMTKTLPLAVEQANSRIISEQLIRNEDGRAYKMMYLRWQIIDAKHLWSAQVLLRFVICA